MWPDLTHARQVGDVLQVLSAMITPAVLILASSSLPLTTSTRSIRCIDRVRERTDELEKLGTATDEVTERRRKHLYEQLEVNIRRARLLKRAMSRFYLGFRFFPRTAG